jgi:hypothetical protein
MLIHEQTNDRRTVGAGMRMSECDMKSVSFSNIERGSRMNVGSTTYQSNGT